MDAQDYTLSAISLIFMAAPERALELEEDIQRLRPQFRRRDNIGGWLLDSGYSAVNFTDVALQQLWVMAHGAWQAYRSGQRALEEYHALDDSHFVLVDYRLAESRVKEAHALAKLIGEHPRGEIPQFPSWLPSLDQYDETDVEQRAVHDLAKIARAFCFLHELEHLRLDETGRDGLEPVDEEMECDLGAIRYLLDSANIYASSEDVDLTTVMFKRTLGISLALYGVFVLTASEAHLSTSSHPPPSERLAQLVAYVLNTIPPESAFWVVLHAMLATCFDDATEPRVLSLADKDWRVQTVALILELTGHDLTKVHHENFGQ
jgi:hypothetical protein